MKSDVMKMLLPMALSSAMPGIGAFLGKSSFLGGMNPMMRSALEQSLLGYGTAKLTGSKHPEKAAMYAGLGSLPFSFMKASNAANLYNDQLSTLQKDPSLFKTELLSPKITASAPWTETIGPGGLEQQLGIGSQIYHPEVISQPSTWGMSDAGKKFMANEPLTAWDVLRGSDKVAKQAASFPDTIRDMRLEGTGADTWESFKDVDLARATGDADVIYSDFEGISPPEVDFYSKVGKGGKNLLGQELKPGKKYTDWLPTIGSQVIGWHGGRPADDELWEDKRMANRKLVAEMYGIPVELLGGLMENPYHTGGGFWKDGGIATLEMDAGGAVNGPGGPKDDVIDAKLSDGEFVMTAKAVENFGGGDRMAGAKRMYNMMNQLDPQSETVQESVIGVA